MNKEQIEKKADEWVDSYPQLDDGTYTQDDVDAMMRNSHIAGAEWMQEQCDEEYFEVIEQKEELAKIMYENRASFDKERERLQAEIRHLEALVEAQKAIIDYKENQLSVLTEQLDASHVFCEGVKEHYINKAGDLYCANCIRRHVCIKLSGYQHDKCIQYQTFIQSMKGE